MRQKVFFEDLGIKSYQPTWDYQESLLLKNTQLKSVNRENNLPANQAANTTLRSPVYTNNTARDAAITSPLSGMLVISGTQFQGYNGSTWVVLNN